jgi:FkbM family methyltransferase
VTADPFVSYAQNGEDVVLFRALGAVEGGRYVDVGANDPVHLSVTYAFYLRGWSGVTIDPVHEYAERQRSVRPRDVMVEAAVSDDPSGSVTVHQIADSGLSTLVDEVAVGHRAAGWAVEDVVVPARRLDEVLAGAGWEGLEIHFMVVDVEGAERAVLETVDLRRWRPWVMVVEATQPLTSVLTHESWESILLDADYRFCLFDGLSRFYVAGEKWAEFHDALSVPANVLDGFERYRVTVLEQENVRLAAECAGLAGERDAVRTERDGLVEELRRRDEVNAAAIVQWRAAAVRGWAASVVRGGAAEVEQLREEIGLHVNHIVHVDAELGRSRDELEAMRRTLSWRVTGPLRRVRGVSRGSGS